MRWAILAVLTLSRMSMAFTFQSVAALGPFLLTERAISYGGLGTLVGAFMFAGVVVAIPGARLAERFGDRRVVIAAAAMMAIGAAVLAYGGPQPVMVVARLFAGIGGVLINVLVTKMVADWFPGRDSVLAMAILITSWPVGLALAMVALPATAVAIGLSSALAVPAGLAALAALLLALLYRSAPDAQPPGATPAPLNRKELTLTLASGGLWAFYNLGIILVISFGPDFAIARGAGAEDASALFSLIGWLSVPAMLILAPLSARVVTPNTAIALCVVTAAGLTMLLMPFGPLFSLLALLGIAIGMAGPMIMSLPATHIPAPKRARAFGLYFTIYYIAMGVVPSLAGLLRDTTQLPAAPLWLSLVAYAIALGSLGLFVRHARTA